MAALAEVPVRSLDQRMTALAKGNEIRSARARLKRELFKKGRPLLVKIIRLETDCREKVGGPEGFLDSMKVADLLVATRTIGPKKRDSYMNRSQVSMGKTLAGMSQGQRDRLIVWIQSGGW